MIIFLYKGGFETAEVMADALACRIENFRATININRLLRKRKIKKTDVLIRWGTTRNPEADSLFFRKEAKVLNAAHCIENNTNKLFSLKMFRSYGANCPNFWDKKEDITQFPVLGRNANHKGGKDIILIKGSNIPGRNDLTKIPKKAFYTEFINSKDEYRVHVMTGKVIRVTKKVFRGHDRFDDEIYDRCVIRNDTYGWGHKAVELDEFLVSNKELISHSVRAVQSVGLSFGAVDVILREGDNKPFVLEVNSCPRLNSVGSELYAEKLIESLKGEGRLKLLS